MLLLVLGSVVIGAILGWIWGYYENIAEIEWWNNRPPEERFCGNYLFTTPEMGAIVGSILGPIIVIITKILFQAFARTKSFWQSFDKTKT